MGDYLKEQSCGAVGFFLCGTLPFESMEKGFETCDHILCFFPWLKRKKTQQGEARLEVWSHDEPDQSFYKDGHGNLFVLVGSPMNTVLWEDAIAQLQQEGDDNFKLPWEGRCLLVRLSPDGKDWTVWNDWMGSIPVFHATVSGVPLVSSLEPVVVSSAGFAPCDFSKRGLIEMLVHGHFFGMDTLFSGMKRLVPDSISRWKDGHFIGSRILWTVTPSNVLWGRDEGELVREMYEQTIQTVSFSFGRRSAWILPLSGGIDSRIIACVGKEKALDLKSYTYGPQGWNEIVYAEKVAQALNFSWERVALGRNYLADYTKMWLDWFGTSMHAHGMYVMPFLTRFDGAQEHFLHGFMGDPLAGNHLDVLYQCGSSPYERLCNLSTLWGVTEIRNVVMFDPCPVLSEMAQMLQDQFDNFCGADFQRQMFIDFWNRQSNLISYQPVMYHYWGGISTPFMHRDYARFCLSLSKDMLENRRLQKMMIKMYWPDFIKIPATSLSSPKRNWFSFTAKRIIKSSPFWRAASFVSRACGRTPNTMGLDCVQATGWKALFPLSPSFDGGGVLNGREVLATINRALNYSHADYIKLTALQPIVYRNNKSPDV